VRTLLAFAMLLIASTVSRAQQGAYRFEITAVGDSTIAFRVPDASWMKPGLKGIAVDPTRHDALIARFTVLRVEGQLATAVITGQTSKVSTAYVALVEPTGKHWYQQPAVWIAGGVGIVAGILIAR
jgi:hypothetical protein